MRQSKCSDDEFVRLFESLGAKATSEQIGVAEKCIYTRRRRIEKKLCRILVPPTKQTERTLGAYPMRLHYDIQDGVVIIGSDAHYWPGDATPAHRGMVQLVRELKPKLVVLNGDVLDGARISRHSRIGWSHTPTLREELDACQERLDEITKAYPKADRYWTLGNHCMRFENKLSQEAGEYEGVKGVRLADQFTDWKHCMSLWLNDDVVVKHRFKGGIHATHNNTLNAGKSMVTGHLHSLKVTPFNDYNGTRWGVDTGTLSDPYGDHAAYAEDNPLNHRSGFVVLTISGGRMLWPEIAAVVDENRIQFRGQILSV